MGFSHRRTTAILYLWTAALAIPAVIAAFTSIWIAILVGLLLLGLSIYLIKTEQIYNPFLKVRS
jgi:UDP-GlcNAc:undecaprenyl-phosphate GlcNAc-1-phosphate transferase